MSEDAHGSPSHAQWLGEPGVVWERVEEERCVLSLTRGYDSVHGHWVAALRGGDTAVLGYGQDREAALEDLARNLVLLPEAYEDTLGECPDWEAPFWERLWARSLELTRWMGRQSDEHA